MSAAITGLFAAIIASQPADTGRMVPAATPARRDGAIVLTSLGFSQVRRQVARATGAGATWLVFLDGEDATIVNRITGDRQDCPATEAGERIAAIWRRSRAAVTFGR